MARTALATMDYEARLRARLAELGERVSGIEDTLAERPDPDPEERSVEREDDEALEGLGHAAALERRQIEAALARIAAGSFGLCVACGGAISAERLEVVPHAPHCRGCARKG